MASCSLVSCVLVALLALGDAAAVDSAQPDKVRLLSAGDNHNADERCSYQWTANKRVLLVHVGKTAGATLLHTLQKWNSNVTQVHEYTGHDSEVLDTALEDFDMYIVPTRDPVSRIVSAFNFLHADGGLSWNNTEFRPGPPAVVKSIMANALDESVHFDYTSFSFLQALSTCFNQLPGGVNAFAEALMGPPGGCNDVARRALFDPSVGTSHIAYGFDYYLGLPADRAGERKLLDMMRLPHKRVFHVSQEDLDADLAAMWAWMCVENPPPTVETHDDPLTGRLQARHDDTELTPEGLRALQTYLAKEYYALSVVAKLTENKREVK